MIGYDATNIIGQSIAVREKIYSFTLSYFIFFYKYLPLLTFDLNTTDTIVGRMSDLIYEYFKNSVIKTELKEKENINKALAKYYLASIYYYEPNYDFGTATPNQAYELGNIYLKQLIQENINLFITSFKEKVGFKFTLPQYDKDWKYFVFALLKTKYSNEYSNIIQQPVCLPTAVRNPVIVLGDGEQYPDKPVDGSMRMKLIANFLKTGATGESNQFKVLKQIEYANYDIASHYNLSDSSGKTWEDAPNIIKFFVKTGLLDLNTVGSPAKNNEFVNYLTNKIKSESEIFVSYYETGTTSTLVNQIGDEAGGESNYSITFPPRAILGPQGVAEKDQIELSVFFEFSFQPNYEKILLDFNIEKKYYDKLKSLYFLNLSKTETYWLIYYLTKKDIAANALFKSQYLDTISEQQFASLFDLQVSLKYRIPKRHLNQQIETRAANYKVAPDSTNGTSFDTRFHYFGNSFTTNDKMTYFLYNPLTKPEENTDESIAINTSINLGNAFEEFGIDSIRKFNPHDLFQDDTKLEKFISKIENSPLLKEFETNLNYNPFDYSQLIFKILSINAAQLPETLINDNEQLFFKPYSQFSKNLLDNLINNIDKI